MFLLEVVRALKKARVPYALVGGYAVALHGALRGTIDIDLVISLSALHLKKTEEAFLGLGLLSRIPVSHDEIFKFREEYIAKRNLIAWNFYSPKDPSKIVDLILTHDLRKMKTVKKKIASQEIVVLGVKDLIAMKKASGRPQDLIDVEALRKLHP